MRGQARRAGLRQQNSDEDPGGIPPAVGSLREIPLGKLRTEIKKVKA